MRMALAMGLAVLASAAACSKYAAGPPSLEPDGGALPMTATPRPAIVFEKHTLDTAYRGEGVGIFDVDNDGHVDIVTDQYWYGGPAFTSAHEIRTPVAMDPLTQFQSGFGVYPWDVNGDGWTDAVVVPHHGEAMVWYENPRGGDVHWPMHTVAAAGIFDMEYGIVVDLFGDGRPVALMGDAQSLVVSWYVPGPDPTQPWMGHPVSPTGFPGAADAHHGMGAGDVDGDGKLDVLTPVAWFQQTADRDVWIEHPLSPSLWPSPSPTPTASLTDPSQACSRMWAYDVNRDGLADILCTRPHDYGVYWIEQRPSTADAGPSFVAHTVDTTTTSEMHALVLADLDGDGLPELVTGKRWYAELPPDPDPGGDRPPLLVYYAMRRTTGGVAFDEHTLDDASGVGAQFSVQDLDGDGKPDIVVENKTGLHYFLQLLQR